MDRQDEEKTDGKPIGEPCSKKQQLDTTESNEVDHPTSIVRIPGSKEDWRYNMRHKRRGIAAIFNHKTFDLAEQSDRHGTEADTEALRSVLEELRYEVQLHQDLTYKQISAELEKLSKLDHGDCDSIVIAVLSHGEKGRLFSRDKSYKTRTLSDPFTADKCQSLAGKPKIFFIQACQGSSREFGTRVDFEGTAPDAELFEDTPDFSYTIPNHADFLMCYAAIPGYVAMRNTSQGTWFIQSLCKVLREHHSDRHLVDMMTCVNRRVAFEYVTSSSRTKQIPCVESMLTREVYFEPKTSY